MALLPATTTPNPFSKTEEYILDCLAEGLTVNDMAKRLAGSDKRKRQRLKRKLARIIAENEEFARAVVRRSQAEMALGLPAASRSLASRAGRGNVQATKLLFEATGLHNPRVKHEHSGEITVKLDMPRPSFGQEGEITDATVVDEPAAD